MNGTAGVCGPLSPDFILGEWLVEPRTDRVIRGGVERRLRPRVMDLIVFLASRSGQVVSKPEILDAVWSTRIVSESVLSSAIAEIREAFGDEPEKPWLIETIPKRGYRLLVQPRALPNAAVSGPVPGPPEGPWPEGASAVFVGREAELGQLDLALRNALSGRGRAVFVVGEAGSGKTACLAEFARRVLESETAVAVAGGKCQLPVVAAEPYLPFLEALRVLAGDAEGGWLPGCERGRAAMLSAGWGRILAEVVVGSGPLLPGTLLPGQKPKYPPGAGVLLGELEATLRAFSLRRPLVLLLDDLHWADRGSIALLFRLGRQLARSRIVLVGSFRAEEFPEATGRHPLKRALDELARCGGGEFFVRLGGGPDRGFLDALVDAVPNRLDAGFRSALFDLTEGQPLFTIEILRSLRAGGCLAPDGEGQWVVQRPIDWRAMPTRVEAIVRERVESLDGLSRDVLEVASIEGEEFCADTVAAALDQPVQRVVDVLSGVLGRQRHLVAPSGPRAVGGRRVSFYRFRHALFQRYLYGRLDEAERCLGHDRIARAIRSVHGGKGTEVERTLARHLVDGTRPALAVDSLLSIADRIHASGVPEEALADYELAVSLLEKDPGTADAAVLLRRALEGQARSAGVTHGHGDARVGEALHRLCRLCSEGGDEPGRFRALVQLAGHHGARGETREARDVARQALESARLRGSPLEDSCAHGLAGVAEAVGGDLREAVKLFARAEELRDEVSCGAPPASLDGHDPAVPVGCWWAFALLLLGSPEAARERGRKTLELAHQGRSPYGIGLAHGLGEGIVLVVEGRSSEALGPAREVLSRAEAHGYPTLLGLGEFLMGSVLHELGVFQDGERRVRRGLEILASAHHLSGRSILLGRLSEMLGAAGRMGESLEVAEEAVATAERCGELNYLPDLVRIAGEASAAAGRSTREVGALLERALAGARERGATFLELRCAASLDRFTERSGRSTHVTAA